MLGKYKTGSMFNLFNTVKTRGGELLLEDMFRTPLSSAQDINIRSSRIDYLRKIDIVFDINRESTEKAAQYLTESRPPNKLASLINCVKESVQKIIYSSDKYDIEQNHIQ